MFSLRPLPSRPTVANECKYLGTFSIGALLFHLRECWWLWECENARGEETLRGSFVDSLVISTGGGNACEEMVFISHSDHVQSRESLQSREHIGELVGCWVLVGCGLLSTTNTGHQPVVNATGHQTKVFTTARDDLWWWDWYQIKVIWILESKSKNSFHHQHQLHCYWTRVAHTHWWRHNIIFGSHLKFSYNICTCDSLHNNRLSCHRWCQHLDAVKIRRWQELICALTLSVEELKTWPMVADDRPLCSRWLLI